jgi:hypothetical protein
LPPSRDKECLPKLLATTQEISDTLGLLGSDWSPQEFTDYTQAAANYSLAGRHQRVLVRLRDANGTA